MANMASIVPHIVKTEKDVLCGKGGASNSHPGNEAYRRKLIKYQPKYKRCDARGKRKMIDDALLWVKNVQKGRFIAFEKTTSSYYIVLDAQARAKVGQYLREDHTDEGRKQKEARRSVNKP